MKNIKLRKLLGSISATAIAGSTLLTVAACTPPGATKVTQSDITGVKHKIDGIKGADLKLDLAVTANTESEAKKAVGSKIQTKIGTLKKGIIVKSKFTDFQAAVQGTNGQIKVEYTISASGLKDEKSSKLEFSWEFKSASVTAQTNISTAQAEVTKKVTGLTLTVSDATTLADVKKVVKLDDAALVEQLQAVVKPSSSVIKTNLEIGDIYTSVSGDTKITDNADVQTAKDVFVAVKGINGLTGSVRVKVVLT